MLQFRYITGPDFLKTFFTLALNRNVNDHDLICIRMPRTKQWIFDYAILKLHFSQYYILTKYCAHCHLDNALIDIIIPIIFPFIVQTYFSCS